MQDYFGLSSIFAFKCLVVISIVLLNIGLIGALLTRESSKEHGTESEGFDDETAAGSLADRLLREKSAASLAQFDTSPSQVNEEPGRRIFADKNGVTLPKFLAVAVAVSTILSGVFAAFQWRAMRAQNDVALASLELSSKSLAVMEGELRAWVEIGIPIIKQTVDGDLSYDVPLTNTGKTTAEITFWGADIVQIKMEDGEEPYYDLEKYYHDDEGDVPNDYSAPGLEIPPGKTVYITTHYWSEGGVGKDFERRVKEGLVHLTFYGWLGYKDPFRAYDKRMWSLYFDAASGTYTPGGGVFYSQPPP